MRRVSDSSVVTIGPSCLNFAAHYCLHFCIYTIITQQWFLILSRISQCNFTSNVLFIATEHKWKTMQENNGIFRHYVQLCAEFLVVCAPCSACVGLVERPQITVHGRHWHALGRWRGWPRDCTQTNWRGWLQHWRRPVVGHSWVDCVHSAQQRRRPKVSDDVHWSVQLRCEPQVSGRWSCAWRRSQLVSHGVPHGMMMCLSCYCE